MLQFAHFEPSSRNLQIKSQFSNWTHKSIQSRKSRIKRLVAQFECDSEVCSGRAKDARYWTRRVETIDAHSLPNVQWIRPGWLDWSRLPRASRARSRLWLSFASRTSCCRLCHFQKKCPSCASCSTLNELSISVCALRSAAATPPTGVRLQVELRAAAQLSELSASVCWSKWDDRIFIHLSSIMLSPTTNLAGAAPHRALFALLSDQPPIVLSRQWQIFWDFDSIVR